ncbi:MAG: T9SS type A sorting domain-containing protein, partial [Bacteroidetes bacterium]|nr:T9SS type A sorting domain-containing protein [Bacteroidota bacterium]
VITGLTDSWNYPTTPGVVQSRYGGGEDDIFVTKFNHDVSELIFSTYIGGSGWDEGRSLRFTPDGNILVAGYTNSDNFPVTEDALYSRRAAFDEGCVFILTPGGRRLVYSTYIAWDTHEDARAAYIADDGVMTVFGLTTSTDLPVNEDSFQKRKGDYPALNPTIPDFYVLKYRLDTGDILACTYLGGSGSEKYPRAFIPLSGGNVLIGGTGSSIDYPITVDINTAESGDYAIELSVINSSLSDLSYSIRVGGSDYSSLYFAHVEQNMLFLSGFTYSADYPITSNALQAQHNGMADAFFTILDLSSVLVGFDAPVLLPETVLLAANYPNPVRDETTIPFSLPAAGHVSLSVHDLVGRQVLRVLDAHFNAGTHAVTVSLGRLPPGPYVVRLLTAAGIQSRILQVF